MIIATLLAGAALQAALPPLPPAPPAPPSLAAPPAPPLPPLPPIAGGDQQVMTFNDNGRHVTIIKRRAGERNAAVTGQSNNVLTYKDASGRDVTVFSDKPMTQADAERMERDIQAKIPEITRHAREQAAQARLSADDARRMGEDARRAGEQARREGEKAREYAQVIVRQMKDADGRWRFDAGPSTGVFRQGEFAGPGDMKELREEMRALRAEMEELRAQLKSDQRH